MRDFLHHLLAPRASNNHRAKILHHTSLLVLIITLLLGNLGIGYLESHNSSILGITANFNADDLLLQTNAKRAEQGLPPLQLNAQLSEAAYAKGQDMMAKNYWAHNSPDGTTPWVFIKGSGYQYLYAGENLARGFSSAPDVVNAWMNSQGHRDNLLSPNYDDVGFAIVTGNLTGDETILVVQEFGKKMAGSPDQSSVASTTTQTTPVPPTATPVPIAARTSPTAIPTLVPSPTPLIVQLTPTPAERFLVASVQSNPLIDADSFSKNFTVILVIFLLIVLLIDVIIIERNQIVRLLSHNIDHVMFLTIILIILLVMSKGTIM